MESQMVRRHPAVRKKSRLRVVPFRLSPPDGSVQPAGLASAHAEMLELQYFCQKILDEFAVILITWTFERRYLWLLSRGITASITAAL